MSATTAHEDHHVNMDLDTDDHEPFLENQNLRSDDNHVENETPREGHIASFIRRMGSCCSFDPSDPSQRLRARIILSSGIVLLLIAIHVIFIFVFLSTYKKPEQTDEPGTGEGEEGEQNKNRGLFTYIIMIPNIFFLVCMSCCVCGLCLRRMLQYFITRSESPSAQAFRNHLQRMGLAVLFTNPAPIDNTIQPGHIIELQERLRQRGVDLYRLQLAMVDRDFNESDYEALLELDSQNVPTRGASEGEIARLPIFKIPFVRDETPREEDLNNQASAASSSVTVVDLPNSPSDVPYCSNKLAQSMIGQVSCPICLENYSCGDCVSTLPCLHRFHRDCINQALRIKTNCPVCQTGVF
jgi:hypothetical protein